MGAARGPTGPRHRAIPSWYQTWGPREPVHVPLKAWATQQRFLLAPPGCPTHPGRQGREAAPNLALELAKQEVAVSTAKPRQAGCQAESPRLCLTSQRSESSQDGWCRNKIWQSWENTVHISFCRALPASSSLHGFLTARCVGIALSGPLSMKRPG